MMMPLESLASALAAFLGSNRIFPDQGGSVGIFRRRRSSSLSSSLPPFPLGFTYQSTTPFFAFTCFA